jgi:fused signal recognition particle receptor
MINPFRKLKEGLAKSRESFRSGLAAVFKRRAGLPPESLEELEEILLRADLGPRVAGRLTAEVKRSAAKGDEPAMERALAVVRREIEAILAAPGDAGEAGAPAGAPHVVLVIGVNGTGKTTTVAKLAHRHASRGEKVLVAAADTYRAAAGDQLAIWAERAGVEIVRQRHGADPAAVAFDAAEAASARGIEFLLVDTAGRLHTRDDLRAELAKIARVLARKIPGAPHETLLVLDGSTGQTALSQAELFRQTIPITGLVVTKLDGTARAGIVVAIREKTGIPVRYVGVGEEMEDLQDFDPAAFAEALVGGDREEE